MAAAIVVFLVFLFGLFAGFVLAYWIVFKNLAFNGVDLSKAFSRLPSSALSVD